MPTQICSIVLAATLLACTAPAQTTGTQPAPKPAPTPAQSSESARALLERAAFEENNKRDFAAAEKLYGEAEAAARAANDPKTAEAASAARARVLARQGKAPATKAQLDEDLRARTRGSALAVLFRAHADASNSEAISRAIQDLADLGPSVVPLLEESLKPSTASGPISGVPYLPDVAARALARMSNADADAVLVRAYDTPDPLVRRAVVVAAEGPRFLELMLRASSDEVASIRIVSTERLFENSDVRAAPAMEELARTGNLEALAWLQRYALERLLTVAEDTSLSAEIRNLSIQRLHSKIDASMARRLVAIAILDPSPLVSDQSLFHSALYAAGSFELAPNAPRDADVVEMEKTLVEASRTDRSTRCVWVLTKLRSPQALTALRNLVSTLQSNPSKNELTGLANVMSEVLALRVDGEPFDAWMDLFTTIPPTWMGQSGSIASRLAEGLLASTNSAPLSRVIAAWEKVPESHRVAYTDGLRGRFEWELRGSAVPVLDEKADGPLRFMLRSDNGKWWQIASQIVRRCDRIELASELISGERIGVSEFRNAAQSLAQRHPAEIRRLVAAELSSILASEDLDGRSPEVTSWLDVLKSSESLAAWKELWAQKPPAAGQRALLRHLVERHYPVERARLLVELYPDIERELPDHRFKAIEWFGQALVEEALPILERELRSADSKVRSAALAAATQFRTQREAIAEFEAWRRVTTAEQETVAELSKLLESNNRDVVIGAVKALGILRARPALPSLVKLLSRDDAALRTAVQAAIDAIGTP